MRFDRESITKGSNVSGNLCMQEGIKLRKKITAKILRGINAKRESYELWRGIKLK